MAILRCYQPSIHQLEKLESTWLLFLLMQPLQVIYHEQSIPHRSLLDQLETPLELQATPALREWNLGKLEGAKISTISAIYPQQMDAFRHNQPAFKMKS